jgi:hypothetical protein
MEKIQSSSESLPKEGEAIDPEEGETEMDLDEHDLSQNRYGKYKAGLLQEGIVHHSPILAQQCS